MLLHLLRCGYGSLMVIPLNKFYDRELLKPYVLNPLLQLSWLILDGEVQSKYCMWLDNVGVGMMM